MSDITLCNPIDEQSTKNSCIYDVAKKTGDVNVCLKADPNIIWEDYNKSGKDICYFSIARKFKNENFCNNIQNKVNRYYCILDIAFKFHKQDACDNIDFIVEANKPVFGKNKFSNLSKETCYESLKDLA